MGVSLFYNFKRKGFQNSGLIYLFFCNFLNSQPLYLNFTSYFCVSIRIYAKMLF